MKPIKPAFFAESRMSWPADSRVQCFLVWSIRFLCHRVLLPWWAGLFFLSSLPAQGFQEGFIKGSDGAELYYRKVGNSAKTVIMPGRLFVFEDFRWLGEAGYTFITYDMRNRGRSDAISEGKRLTIEADVADLEAVRRHFQVERFTPIGYSYLGLMVVLYALDYPRHVNRIIQFGAVPMRYGTEYPEELQATRQIGPEIIRKLRARRQEEEHIKDPQNYCEEEWNGVERPRLVGDPAHVDVLPTAEFICSMPNEWPINLARHLQHQFVESVQKLRVPRERIGQLEIPVLTVHGRLDLNAPYGAGVEWARALPNARLMTIDRGAHNAFAEFPDQIRPAVRTFLKGEWPEEAKEVN